MDIPENIINTVRHVFDDGLDEVLIFAFIFIFILLSGHENDDSGNEPVITSILPLILIGAFLLLFFSIGRTETSPE